MDAAKSCTDARYAATRRQMARVWSWALFTTQEVVMIE